MIIIVEVTRLTSFDWSVSTGTGTPGDSVSVQEVCSWHVER